MEERSKLISKLRDSLEYRTAYVKAKLGILVPSQIRALRLQSEMPRQADLAKAANMLQSRISMIETPGAANVTLETLARLAAAFSVGLVVKFVPFSEMLRWENSYSQDEFRVTKIDNDAEFGKDIPIMHRCPVCMYDALPYPPSDYHVCPCCGTEFGNDDKDFSHAQLREMWLASGARWFFGNAPPDCGADYCKHCRKLIE